MSDIEPVQDEERQRRADATDQFQSLLEKLPKDFALYRPEDAGRPESLRYRRGRRRGDLEEADRASVTLALDSSNALRLFDSETALTFVGDDSPRRAWRRSREEVSGVVNTLSFQKLMPNEVTGFIEARDRGFAAKLEGRSILEASVGDPSPLYKLLRWEGENDGEWSAKETPLPTAGRKLLILHGTFSNGQNVVRGILASAEDKKEEGKAFFDKAKELYSGGIYTFEHPTLSVSPLANAIDLRRLFSGVAGDIDVICHSRGGLVARWWLEGIGGAEGRLVRVALVGCPLGGTSLIAPPNIKATLEAMANYGGLLAKAGSALPIPFFEAAMALLKVVSSTVKIAAHTPAVDGVIAMIPGLAAQQRIANNLELRRLYHVPASSLPEYFVVQSNFEPEGIEWNPLKWVRKAKDVVADAAVDFVFDDENDMVVNTVSMTHALKPKDTLDFGTSNMVHHTNYFDQPKTIQSLCKWFEIS